MAQRILGIKKERLSELTTDELVAVAGAALPIPETLKISDCFQTLQGCTTAMTCPRPQD
jgi:hypothetical protein